MITITQTQTKWKGGSALQFVLVDGMFTSPILMAERYVFRLHDKAFAVPVHMLRRLIVSCD